MKTFARIGVVVCVWLIAGAAVGQWSRGDRGDRPRGERGRRGFDSGPMSADETSQRLARVESMLRNMDTNKNGLLEADEVSGGQKFFVERILSRANIEAKYPIAINDVLQAMRRSYESRGEGAGSSGPPSPAAAPPPKVMGFGPPAGVQPPPGFGEAKPPPGPPPATAATPAVAAAPAASVPPAAGTPPASSAAPPTPAAAGTAPVPAPAATPATPAPTAESGAAAKTSVRKSGRFLTPKERLPKGLPDWFVEKDADGDGQVTMAEFASEWTREKAVEFDRYDLNHDGVITAAECLKVEKEKEKGSR